MSVSATANIVNTIVNNDNINILYCPHNSVFDLILGSLDYNLSDLDNSEYPWINIFASNDPVLFSQKHIKKCNELHVNSILFFHNDPPQQFKKEDIMILKKHIINSHKILCSSDLIRSWLPSDNKWHVIDYGIPNLIADTSLERDTNITFLNFNKNANIQSLFNNVNNQIPNCKIINSLPNSLSDFYDIMQQTKICMDFENTINSLVAATCGAFCVTSYDNSHLFYYKKLLGVDNISNILTEILAQIDYDKVNIQANDILDKFSFDTFIGRISLITRSIMKEKFIL